MWLNSWNDIVDYGFRKLEEYEVIIPDDQKEAWSRASVDQRQGSTKEKRSWLSPSGPF